ncbi:4440_t:CDS:2, partial [Ambispora gerdemannii]
MLCKEPFVLPAEETTVIDLGIAVEVPKNSLMQLASRSSLAKKGITVEGGIVDAGY